MTAEIFGLFTRRSGYLQFIKSYPVDTSRAGLLTRESIKLYIRVLNLAVAKGFAVGVAREFDGSFITRLEDSEEFAHLFMVDLNGFNDDEARAFMAMGVEYERDSDDIPGEEEGEEDSMEIEDSQDM